ncbi:MAG: hypothetical protein R3E89_02540 [Thiolinea sp.]
MDNGFPPNGTELALRHPHLNGLEAQQNNPRLPGQDVQIPAEITTALENLSRGQIELTRVNDLDASSAEYSLNRQDPASTDSVQSGR